MRPSVAGEFLVGVRMPVLQRPIGVYDRSGEKCVWEDDRDLGPLLVFFVPAIGVPHILRHERIALGRELDSAMAGGREGRIGPDP